MLYNIELSYNYKIEANSVEQAKQYAKDQWDNNVPLGEDMNIKIEKIKTENEKTEKYLKNYWKGGEYNE